MLKVILHQIEPNILINYVGGLAYSYDSGDIERDFHQLGSDLKAQKIRRILIIPRLPANLEKILNHYKVRATYGK